MADISIDASVSTSTARGMRSVVFTTALIGYWFYIDSTGTFVYSKTTDGGATWGAAVMMAAATTHLAFDVWFDQWTPGDSGTLIHTWWFDSTNDDVRWGTLDTNGDTLGLVRTVFNGATAVAGRGVFVSGTKCQPNGPTTCLYCAFDIDAGAEKGLYQSVDNGVNWSSLSATFVEATLDQCLLFPASNTGDNNDCWALYHDASVDALTLKIWDSSAAGANETATILTLIENVTDLTGQYGFSGAVRHSDGHLIVSAISERDTATADHRIFDINGISSTTEKTAITTNIDDHYNNAVFIDQGTGHIYVAYNGKRDGSEVLGTTTKVYYVKSTDGGVTWSAGDTAYMEGAAGVVVQVWAPLSGARFYVGWRVGTTLVGNAVNSVGMGIALAGAAQGQASATGALTTGIPLLGAAIVSATATGDLTVPKPLAGATVAEASAQGALTTGISLAGSAAVAVVANGELATVIQLSGAAIAQALAAAGLTTEILLAGAAAGQASAAGDLTTGTGGGGGTSLDGSAQANAAASGALTTQIQLAAAVAAAVSASGGLSTGIQLSGAAQVQAQASGLLVSSEVPLAGSTQAVPAASGEITVQIRLNGAALVQAAAAAGLSTGIQLAGAAQVQAQASGLLGSSEAPLAGSAQAVSAGAGALTTGIPLAGASVVANSADGSLTTEIRLTAAALAQALAAGALTTQIRLEGAAIAQMLGAGAIGDYVYVPSAPESTITVRGESRVIRISESRLFKARAEVRSLRVQRENRTLKAVGHD